MSKSTINTPSQGMALQRVLRWYESHAERFDRGVVQSRAGANFYKSKTPMPHTAKTQTKRGQQRVHEIERTGQHFLSVLEKATERRFSALFKHLNVVSRQEVRGLLRRVAQLEQRLTRSDQSTTT